MVDQIIRETPAIMQPDRSDERTTVELSLLLDAVVRWAGYDFRDYAPALIKRRVAERLRAESVETISGLQERVLHDDGALERLIFAMSSTSNRLFRTPEYFKAIRERVVPLLRTYPFVRLWFPACSTGEDVFTLATILWEAGLLDRCMIYATDLSTLALEHARKASYEIASVEDFAADYRMSGGRVPLSEFCDAAEHTVRFHPAIAEQIIFSRHSLATDASLNEFHAIVARGILPQFSKSLQYRVHNLVLQSLSRLGFLALSSAESLHATPHEGVFRKIDDVFPLYRRMR